MLVGMWSVLGFQRQPPDRDYDVQAREESRRFPGIVQREDVDADADVDAGMM